MSFIAWQPCRGWDASCRSSLDSWREEGVTVRLSGASIPVHRTSLPAGQRAGTLGMPLASASHEITFCNGFAASESVPAAAGLSPRGARSMMLPRDSGRPEVARAAVQDCGRSDSHRRGHPRPSGARPDPWRRLGLHHLLPGRGPRRLGGRPPGRGACHGYRCLGRRLLLCRAPPVAGHCRRRAARRVGRGTSSWRPP